MTTRWSDAFALGAVVCALGCTLLTNPSSFEQGPQRDGGEPDAPERDVNVDAPGRDAPDTDGRCANDVDCGGVGLCEGDRCVPCGCATPTQACLRAGEGHLCVECDLDEDGFLSADPDCDLLAAGATRDCDDDGDGFEIVRAGLCEGPAGPDCDDQDARRRPGFYEDCDLGSASFCTAPTEGLAPGYAGERWVRIGDAPLGTALPPFAPPLAIEARPGVDDEWLVLSATAGPIGLDLRRVAMSGTGAAPAVTAVPAMGALLDAVGEVYHADMARTLDVLHVGMTGRVELSGFVRTFQVREDLAFSTGRVSTQDVLVGPVAVSPGVGGGTARTYYYRRDAGSDRVAYLASDGGSDDRAWTLSTDRSLAAAQDFGVVENGGRYAIWREDSLTEFAVADGPTVKLLPASATEHSLVVDGCGGVAAPPSFRCGDVHRVRCSPLCTAMVQGRLAIPAPPGLARFGVARSRDGSSFVVAHGVAAPGGLRVVLTEYAAFEPNGEMGAFDGLVFDRIDSIDLESRQSTGRYELTLAVHGRTPDDLGGVYVQVFRYCGP